MPARLSHFKVILLPSLLRCFSLPLSSELLELAARVPQKVSLQIGRILSYYLARLLPALFYRMPLSF